MPTTTRGKPLLAASVTAISALGMLTAPAPAQAAPSCEVYGFDGNVTIKGNGAIIELSFSANGTTAGGPATAMSDKGGVAQGFISGGIVENGPRIHLTFTPDAGGGADVFTGSIRESDLIATGTQGPGTWSTVAPLACLKQGPPPQKPRVFGALKGDVDMYDKPGGNKYPGFLEGSEAQTVEIITCQADNWCNVIAPGIGPVWIWGDLIWQN